MEEISVASIDHATPINNVTVKTLLMTKPDGTEEPYTIECCLSCRCIRTTSNGFSWILSTHLDIRCDYLNSPVCPHFAPKPKSKSN